MERKQVFLFEMGNYNGVKGTRDVPKAKKKTQQLFAKLKQLRKEQRTRSERKGKPLRSKKEFKL